LVPALQRLAEDVKWRPRFALNEALSDTIAWWRSRLALGASAERRG
jgi:nucleoside-diphosphate-sugar epimerase